MDNDTPMIKQYKEIKAEHQNSVLLFRMGDFYEMFFSDAEEISQLLNLNLTKRQGIPMAGIPYHALQNYLPRLLQCGKRIAICEQTELPQKAGRGISKREVVEIVSPGTVLQEEFLDRGANNYLQAFCNLGQNLGMALLDFSTGEFIAGSFYAPSIELRSEILQRELLLAHSRELLLMEELHDEFSHEFWNQGNSHGNTARLCNRIPFWCFNPESAERKLLEFFGVQSLKGFGFEEQAVKAPNKARVKHTTGAKSTNSVYGAAFGAAWVVLEYLHQNQQQVFSHVLGHVQRLLPLQRKEQLQLDSAALRNLEIFQNMQDGSQNYSLFQVLHRCQSSIGSRCLHRWLRQPLLDKTQLEQRYQKVAVLLSDTLLRSDIREMLSQLSDLERVMSRISTAKANARDLVALRQSLALYQQIYTKVGQSENAQLLQSLFVNDKQKNSVAQLTNLLQRSITETPPVLLHEGGMIADGYSQELDELRAMLGNRREVLDAYVAKEQAQIRTVKLKLKYNRIIGYYFEITKAQAAQIQLPQHFIRRQSLVNNERYSTEELAELEAKLNSADEQIVQLERQLFEALRESILPETSLVLRLSKGLAELDVLANFAEIAERYNYVLPELLEQGSSLSIEAGRHPVVEHYLQDYDFVPNHLVLDRKRFFALITGPNMAGKSTYLRQNALIVLMAQIGCYVPARKACIPIVDRIFCRVGASDNLSRGESTFMVEMQETARILHEASRYSLVIMDEVGRGTSTRDGLAIAQSISEYILHTIQCMTLFATHYHELTRLSEQHLQLLCLAVDDNGEKIRFLKHVQEGAIASSYGIHVAALAGIPAAVTKRAEEIILRGAYPTESTELKSPQAALANAQTQIILTRESEQQSKPEDKQRGYEVGRSQQAQSASLLFSEPDLLFEDLMALTKEHGPNLEHLNEVFALQILQLWANKYL